LLILHETRVNVYCVCCQCELEESLFRRHPASLRRTAEFIAERVASNVIKKLQQTVLKTMLTRCQQWAATTPADVTVNDRYTLIIVIKKIWQFKMMFMDNVRQLKR